MEILREQFTGLIIFSFSFTLCTFISNIEARIFLDTHIKKACTSNTYDYIIFRRQLAQAYEHNFYETASGQYYTFLFIKLFWIHSEKLFKSSQ